MKVIVSQVKHIVKGNVSHIKLICDAMNMRGWTQADLSRASGVSTGTLSKYFNPANDKSMSADNLFDVLKALDLIKSDDTCSDHCEVGCDEVTQKLCKKLKKIVDFGKPYSTAIEANIDCFEDSVEIRKELKNLKVMRTKGQKPVRCKERQGVSV